MVLEICYHAKAMEVCSTKQEAQTQRSLSVLFGRLYKITYAEDIGLNATSRVYMFVKNIM